jgi:hypothetical protein
MSSETHRTKTTMTRPHEARLAHPSYWGVDRDPANRPGVPKEITPPHTLPGVHWIEPPQQIPTTEVLERADLDKLTPVFGTAQPPRGVSGAIRRYAYTIPDHEARHWMLLLLADRVDVIEHGDGLRRLLPVAVLAAGAAGAWLALRPRRRRSLLRRLISR